METMAPEFEQFVDAARAAEFLCLSRKHVLKLSRQPGFPGHPISFGQRKTWRYLLSELREWVLANGILRSVGATGPKAVTSISGSPRKGGR